LRAAQGEKALPQFEWGRGKGGQRRQQRASTLTQRGDELRGVRVALEVIFEAAGGGGRVLGRRRRQGNLMSQRRLARDGDEDAIAHEVVPDAAGRVEQGFEGGAID
jgi:hypothetical protein